MQVVWLKRDLRVADHAPLTLAAERQGQLVCLYVYEPELFAAPDATRYLDASHLTFLHESLAELRRDLRARGSELFVRVGALPQLFEELHRSVPITGLWSHEETGDGASYARDVRVAAWCKSHNIPWTELPQTGVVRRLKQRDGWAARWLERMRQPVIAAPLRLPAPPKLEPGELPSLEALGYPPTTKRDLQRGGESEGHRTLDSFLAARGLRYSRALSSPVTAWDECSRLSVYLSFGNLSMRQVYQAAQQRRRGLFGERSPEATAWRRSLTAFEARIRWHCHFMQKLEDEPRIEFENLSRATIGLRETEFDESYFSAWSRGETGYPMIDACMRALLQSSWINFRMRAMLVSFAAYDLWLHWRRPAIHLARHFLDFEPGIHFSQLQMQSGTTGINTMRIYSPTKQLLDHDPKGLFVRRYLPELAGVPDGYLATPWKMGEALQQQVGCVLGRDYPRPIVAHEEAVKAARTRLAAVRRKPETRSESQAIVKKHGSRKRTPRRQTKGTAQLSFDDV